VRAFSTTSWPNVVFGDDVSKNTGRLLKESGVTKVMVVFDRGIFEAGIVTPILNVIDTEGIEIVEFGKALPDPPDTVIEEGALLANSQNIDGILGIGGGSSMDTAKVIAVYRHCEPPLNQYYDGAAKGNPNFKTRRDATLILIPTTSGTGAEMTAGGVITDTTANAKRSFPSMKAQADLAILDPVLTLGLPPHITATTGMDALCQAVECMTSNRRNVRTDMICGYVIENIWRYLPIAWENGDDLEARGVLMNAANLSLSNGGATNMGHAIATAMGGRLNIVHGHACALVLPEQVRFVADVADREIRIIAQKIGLNPKSVNIADDVALEINKLLKKFDIKTPKEMGISKNDFLSISDEIFGAQSFFFTRMDKMPTEDEMKKILIRIFG
jgi:alcohol dehydrogenase